MLTQTNTIKFQPKQKYQTLDLLFIKKTKKLMSTVKEFR